MNVISEYRLGERIGAGSMAEVFRAETIGAEGVSAHAAIKRLLPERAAHADFVAHFSNEARLMANLKHPNIVQVLDFTRDAQGYPCLVMELVDGIALTSLTKHGALPIPVAVHIIRCILRGLCHAHDCTDEEGKPLGLVHRDLSTNNVLLSWDGDVKIADFGLARAYAQDALPSPNPYGTVCYMSPEQVEGRVLDRRSDLFAVGVLFYQLLTGALPFQGSIPVVVVHAIRDRTVRSPRELRPELPTDLEALVLQLLEREPDDRPAHAEAALAALDRCQVVASLAGRDALRALLHERFPTQSARLDAALVPETEQPSVHERARWPRAALALALLAPVTAGLAYWLLLRAAPAPLAPPGASQTAPTATNHESPQRPPARPAPIVATSAPAEAKDHSPAPAASRQPRHRRPWPGSSPVQARRDRPPSRQASSTTQPQSAFFARESAREANP